MFFKAGALSLALLLASRVLGLLRESALAATFGTSGLADVAVLMLTLPDLLAGILASGALAYVLLPAWAGMQPAQVALSQRRVARALVLAASVLAVTLAVLREPAVGWLAAGLSGAVKPAAIDALLWSAVALPAAGVAALWVTRLQHEQDFPGMYSAGVVVNLVLLAGIAAAAGAPGARDAVVWLGCGLLAAMATRLAWLRWRLAPLSGESRAIEPVSLPPAPLWLWAALSAGLPLALPFVARSMASRSGEGALATFNYAWKLVELPLLLAIQLVATLAFPAIARAFSAASAGSFPAAAQAPVRDAFALAFALACACAAGLLAGAPAIAQLLFGWGRMDAGALGEIAQWARIGAWGLLPQALIAVALTLLAAQARMKAAVLAYALALAVLACAGWAGIRQGGPLMELLNLLLTGVAVILMLAIGSRARSWLPWRVMGASLASLLALAFLLTSLPAIEGVVEGVALAALCGVVVLAAAWAADAIGRTGPRDNSSASHD